MQTDEWFSARKAEMLPLPATKWAIMAQEAAALAYEEQRKETERGGSPQIAMWKQRVAALQSRAAQRAADRARKEMNTWRRLEEMCANDYEFIQKWGAAYGNDGGKLKHIAMPKDGRGAVFQVCCETMAKYFDESYLGPITPDRVTRHIADGELIKWEFQDVESGEDLFADDAPKFCPWCGAENAAILLDRGARSAYKAEREAADAD